MANDKDSISNLRTESSKTDKRKQSLYFPESMLQEIKEEAARLDRSLSWVVQRAWKIARTEIKKLPSVNEVEGADDDDEAVMTALPEPSPVKAPCESVRSILLAKVGRLREEPRSSAGTTITRPLRAAAEDVLARPMEKSFLRTMPRWRPPVRPPQHQGPAPVGARSSATGSCVTVSSGSTYGTTSRPTATLRIGTIGDTGEAGPLSTPRRSTSRSTHGT